MATLEETLRSLGLSAARGIPQLATGFVDLAALPFTATGMLKPEQAVGSTAYLTSKGLLPPEQQGLLNQTTELVSSAMNPAVATKAALAKGGLLMAAPIAFAGSIEKPLSNAFNIIKRDASDIFGAGAEKIRYTDPKSGGTIEVLSKPDKSASVLSLEVPEQFRGKKIGESLQARVMQDFPEMQGQVSSKAAAKTAYRLGRRPVGQPNATLDDVFKAIDDSSSVNLVSPEMQKRFTGTQPSGLLGQQAMEAGSGFVGSIKPVKPAESLLNYRSTHIAPSPEFGAPLYDLTGGGQMYPADVYSSKATQYYGTGYPKADKEAFALANRVRGNPEAEVTMYRAVPKSKDITSINAGDWVSLSKDYAKTHGESVLKNNYKIIEQKVKAKDLWTNADSIHEFGYHPSK